jgi:hypothetical protein
MEKQLILFGAQYLYLVIVALLSGGLHIFSQSKELRFKLFISLVISFPSGLYSSRKSEASFLRVLETISFFREFRR